MTAWQHYFLQGCLQNQERKQATGLFLKEVRAYLEEARTIDANTTNIHTLANSR
jgi:hypothetical protein